MGAATVWKYEIRPIGEQQNVVMPTGSWIASAGLDPEGNVCVWAVVDPAESEGEPRRLIACGTGQALELVSGDTLAFIDTVRDVPFMWHVFEIVPTTEGPQ